jgi:HSP20 family protein
MTKLLRDPFIQNMVEFRKEFDQIFHRFFGTPWMQETLLPMTTFVPPVEAFIDNKLQKFFLRIALPGFKPEDVKLTLNGNLLTLAGERKWTPEMENWDYLHRELYFGKFERTLTLPEGVDTERLLAEYKGGLLELTAPVMAGALHRPIEIKTVPEVKRVAV